MASVPRDMEELLELAPQEPVRAVEEAMSYPSPEAAAFLRAIAPSLSVEALGLAFDAALRIPEPEWRATALEGIAPSLPDDMRQRALQEAAAVREQSTDRSPSAMLALAANLEAQGDLVRARSLIAEVVDGPDDAARRSALGALGTVARRLGDLGEAERAEREALRLIEATEGPGSPAALGAMGNLALTLADRGNVEEAQELQRQVIAAMPPDDEARLGAENNLALTLARAGRPEEAAALQERVVEESTARYGGDAVPTLDAMGNLANFLDDLGSHEHARDLRQEIRSRAVRRYGEDHPVARRYEDIPASKVAEPPPRHAGAARPAATIARDFWTADDRLGYDFYADAIAEFVRHRDTRPPLTIGIKAEWGAGKTSLMRMVRGLLDPTADDARRALEPVAHGGVTNSAVLETTRVPPQQRDLAGSASGADLPQGTRPTVWFNAWKYQSGEQVWAGLAHAIVTQLTERMSAVERERFWATLNLRRVDGEAVRRRIYRVLFERLLPLLAAAVLTWALALGAWLLAPVVPATETVRGIAGGSVLASALGVGAAALARRRKFLQENVKDSFAELVRVPDYGGTAGYMHAVHEDMRRVLDLVATERRPVVVFVDDLDRCSYESVAKVIEAINLFLAGEFPNCIFVLAMEPDLVAAQIEVAYKDLFDAVAQDAPARQRGTLGWKFLEKMVQLPLSLPPPEPTQVEDLIDSILDHRAGGRDVPSDGEVRAARDSIRSRAQGGIEDIVATTRAIMDETGSAAGDASYIRAAELEFAEQFSDQDAEVQALIREQAGAFSRNPREIKRFINVFRFYSFIQVRRELRALPAPDYRQVAKIAVLAVRWPHLLGYLGQERDGQETLLSVLERLARMPDGDREGWTPEGLRAAELSDRRCAELLADDELRALLRAEPGVAADARGFL